MVKYNIRSFATVIIGLAILTFITLMLIQDPSEYNVLNIISLISKTISINSILWILFIKWGWKYKMFYSWLVPFPNLAGNWEGVIKSNWQGAINEPIKIEVIIKQTFFNVQVQIKSGESKSNSIGASFDIDSERGIQQLIFTYLNTPRPGVRERSEIHYGSTILNFEGFQVEKMDGEYWTSRETTGEIELIKNAP